MPTGRNRGAPEPTPDERLQPPAAGAGDVTHGLARGGLGSLPLIGPVAAELLGVVLVPEYQRRSADWMNEVAQRIKRLEEAGRLTMEQLMENEAFISTIAQAAQAAGRNHQQEKRDALRNAVLNSSLATEPDDSVQIVFISLIDRFTEWHLRILKFFEDPKGWYASEGVKPPTPYMAGVDAILDPAFPELAKNPGLKAQVDRDLRDAGLADIPNAMMTEGGIWAPRASEWGRRFLHFIQDPE